MEKRFFLNQLNLNQIVETLRKYPAPFTLRKAKNDYAVPGTNIVIEKGMRLIIPIYGIHHDPQVRIITSI